MPDREIFVAAPRVKMPFFLTKLATAIRLGNAWTLVDAAHEHATNGQLRWQQEGTYALVLDGEKPDFLAVGVMPPEFSRARRTAAFRLLANGDLEGECTLIFTGHFAAEYREEIAKAAQGDRQRVATKRILAYVPQAAIGDFRIDDLDEPEKPLSMHFTVAYPGFARRTGTRLEFVPAALPMEVTPQFTSATRTTPVVFPFAWSEEDALTIELPDGFEVEARGAPTSTASLKDGRGTHTTTIELSGRTLTYQRALSMSREAVVVPVDQYSEIRTFFDAVRAAARSGMLLRRKDEGNAQ
jgi:hypothetical protein